MPDHYITLSLDVASIVQLVVNGDVYVDEFHTQSFIQLAFFCEETPGRPKSH